MIPFARLTMLLALLCVGASGAWAQESAAAQELRELRALVEKQSKQIDLLTEQIARLNRALELKAGDGAVPAAMPVLPVAPVPTVEFSSETPKAEAPEGKRHVVIKGETLTSIAKHYNIPLAELQKANKGVDERKLQIGQTLTIPTTATPETSTEKKENP